MSILLLLSSDETLCNELVGCAEKEGHDFVQMAELVAVDRFLQRQTPDVVILDMENADVTGPGLVSLIRERCPHAAIIGIAARYDREIDLHLHTNGITYFAVKPLDTDRLCQIILHCLKKRDRERNRYRTGT